MRSYLHPSITIVVFYAKMILKDLDRENTPLSEIMTVWFQKLFCISVF